MQNNNNKVNIFYSNGINLLKNFLNRKIAKQSYPYQSLDNFIDRTNI